jgi:hypothetical protein
MTSPTRHNAASDSINEIATVRIELRHTDPSILCQVEVPASITLKALHDIIQAIIRGRLGNHPPPRRKPPLSGGAAGTLAACRPSRVLGELLCTFRRPRSAGASNTQYARRNEPRDESSDDCRSCNRGGFVECRIITCEHRHESKVDCSAQTDDGHSILPDFAKHRFAIHSTERAISLERIDDTVRKVSKKFLRLLHSVCQKP